MAFYFTNPFLLTFILLTSPFISIFIFANGSLLETICPQTSNPPLCTAVFNSSAQADLPTLCQVSIDSAQSYAKTSSEMIDTFSQSVADPRARGVYQTDSQMYKDSVRAFDNATHYLKSGDYQNLTGIASAMRFTVDLVDGFLELTPDLPYVGILIESHRRFYALADFVTVIGRNLILHLKG